MRAPLVHNSLPPSYDKRSLSYIRSGCSYFVLRSGGGLEGSRSVKWGLLAGSNWFTNLGTHASRAPCQHRMKVELRSGGFVGGLGKAVTKYSTARIVRCDSRSLGLRLAGSAHSTLYRATALADQMWQQELRYCEMHKLPSGQGYD